MSGDDEDTMVSREEHEDPMPTMSEQAADPERADAIDPRWFAVSEPMAVDDLPRWRRWNRRSRPRASDAQP